MEPGAATGLKFLHGREAAKYQMTLKRFGLPDGAAVEDRHQVGGLLGPG
jgi:hypothetical protein